MAPTTATIIANAVLEEDLMVATLVVWREQMLMKVSLLTGHTNANIYLMPAEVFVVLGDTQNYTTLSKVILTRDMVDLNGFPDLIF
jgi:hypothetical protein